MMQVVRNKKGQVALCHYQPVSIVADVGAKKYNFEYRNHVVLAWVEQDDVSTVLSVMRACSCNGGTRSPRFLYANQAQVNLWHTNDPRKDFESNE